MRTHRDRIRHAVGFEMIALLLSIPIMSFFFSFDIKDIGVIAITGSIMATIWNYGFNIAFDKSLIKFTSSTFKTPMIRVLHVLLFEGGLLMLYLPMVSWYLGILVSLYSKLLLWMRHWLGFIWSIPFLITGLMTSFTRYSILNM